MAQPHRRATVAPASAFFDRCALGGHQPECAAQGLLRRHRAPPPSSWADVILVMEEKHKSRLVAEFTRMLEGKPIHVLDIPDEYKYMDPELVEELQRSVGSILDID
jgi:predicted protein tyrosine phosphatase